MVFDKILGDVAWEMINLIPQKIRRIISIFFFTIGIPMLVWGWFLSGGAIIFIIGFLFIFIGIVFTGKLALSQ